MILENVEQHNFTTVITQVNDSTISENKKTDCNLHKQKIPKENRKKFLIQTIYVPEKVLQKFEVILKNNQPNFKYNTNNFYIILHLIGDIPNYNKKIDINANNGYTSLNSTFLQSNLGIRNYNEYLDYLVENGILETDNHYIPKTKSKGFKYPNELNSFIKPITVELKNKKNIYLTEKIDKKNVAENKYSYLCKWFNNNLEIDYKSAINKITEYYLAESQAYPLLLNQYQNNRIKFILEMQNKNASSAYIYHCLKEFDKENKPSNPIDLYNNRFRTIEKINNKDWSYCIDETAGRFHSTITGVWKILRPYIKYKGQRLRSEDLKNSQIFLSILFLSKAKFIRFGILEKITKYNRKYAKDLKEIEEDKYKYNTIMLVKLIEENENKEDLKRYIELAVSGEIYYFFGKELLGNSFNSYSYKEIKDIGKTELIQCLFRSNAAINFKESSKLFKSLFPSVYAIFKEIKKGKSTDENYKPYRALACVLQTIEAELILDKVCKEFNYLYPNAPIFTTHDCVITTENDIDKIKPILEKHLFDCIGYKPTLHNDDW